MLYPTPRGVSKRSVCCPGVNMRPCMHFILWSHFVPNRKHIKHTSNVCYHTCKVIPCLHLYEQVQYSKPQTHVPGCNILWNHLTTTLIEVAGCKHMDNKKKHLNRNGPSNSQTYINQYWTCLDGVCQQAHWPMVDPRILAPPGNCTSAIAEGLNPKILNWFTTVFHNYM